MSKSRTESLFQWNRASKQLPSKSSQNLILFRKLISRVEILNLTGFRKALKKFEKQTKIPAQQAYTSEKVRSIVSCGREFTNLCNVQIEGCLFASDAKITEMIKDVEKLYATHYSEREHHVETNRLLTSSDLS